MAVAEDSFRQGDLAGCLQALQGEVRRRPDDGAQRVFLVQVLMLLGQWERALNQLGVLQELDASALPMVHSYGAAIQCERNAARRHYINCGQHRSGYRSVDCERVAGDLE